MKKSIIIAILVLPLILISGCSTIAGLMPSSSSQSGAEIIKEAKLASTWKMSQIRVEVTGANETPVLLKLNAGDKVDGYFYLETGSDIDFRITGNSLIYQSVSQGKSGKVTSDRFAFSASQAQGSSYTLSFSNLDDGEEQTEVTAFLEVIYPIGGSIFTPLETR